MPFWEKVNRPGYICYPVGVGVVRGWRRVVVVVGGWGGGGGWRARPASAAAARRALRPSLTPWSCALAAAAASERVAAIAASATEAFDERWW